MSNMNSVAVSVRGQRVAYSRFLRVGGVCLMALAALGLSVPAEAAITIGPGPTIGTDSAGNTFSQEFQDWTHADCRALDGAGITVGGRYNFNDGYDDSRDLVAFYSRSEGSNVYFRVDLYDLAIGAENGNLDIYLAIDCAAGGQNWMPDWTDVQVDPSHAWEVCVKLYDSTNHDVINANWQSVGGFLGVYFNASLDSVEFGISRQTLLNAGWDGSRIMYFTVMTTRDGTNGGPGEINGGAGSDATDTFFDDDRGYSDGVINGAIASNSGVGRAKFASIAHGNQSINKNNDIRVRIFDPPTAQKTGFIRALDTHEIFNVPLNIHPSGTLLSACKWAKAAPGDDPRTDGPAFLQRIAQFVNDDQNDGKPGSLIGGVFAEHIMPYFEGPVNAASIEQFDEIADAVFGLTASEMRVMHTPERVIRSQPTGLAPLDGMTFEDIQNSGYQATVLDEITHIHWWFYPSDPWSGYNGGFDAPRLHKIHKINGVYCFAINDREDQAKFGNHDGGLPLDPRYTLLAKASDADQAQLTLIFDDWEAMAGKSFDPGVGQSMPNNNQSQYQTNIRWIANHQWIEVVNLKDVLDRAVNNANPQYNAGWVIDHGNQSNLSIQNYEWLKHACEGSYNYWYYNNDSGFGGNEQNFYDLVPVITGSQGDYHRRFGNAITNDAQANSVDGPKLPSGKKFGDLNTPGTLMHDAWATIATAPAGRLKKLAEYTYSTLIYETAWHEEDDGSTGSYQGTNYGNPWPHPDTTWDGLNTWALKLHNHIRSAGIIADAARWADAVRSGTQSPATSAIAVDLDQDGQQEYVLKNNRVYVCFEKWGGRLTYGFAFDRNLNDAIQVLGSPVTNPTNEGEEEGMGPGTNRCSTFKDMNGTYVDAAYNASILGSDTLQFTSADGKVNKRIRLPLGTARLDANYTNATGSNLYVRIGASPNNGDLILHGWDHLTTASTPTEYRVTNSAGGEVKVLLGTAQLNPAPADAGYLNRNLALIEQIEVYGGSAFAFSVELGSPYCPAGSVPGDFDGDCDVDGTDLAHFEACRTAATVAQTAPGCQNARMDADTDVDQADFGIFQRCLSGANVPGEPSMRTPAGFAARQEPPPSLCWPTQPKAQSPKPQVASRKPPPS